VQNKNLHDDRMSYECYWCGHSWHFYFDKTATNDQIDEWFGQVRKEHYEICKMYRNLRDSEIKIGD
jgi:hypothetical protein